MAIRSHRMLSGLTRSPTRLLVVAATILLLTALALAPSVSASSPRSGELHLTKDCSTQHGAAGDFCTITSSNLKAIEVGSRVVYLQAACFTCTPPALNSDVVLVVGPGNTASGHCYLPFPIGPGLCTFSGGTGKFTHFHASAAVTLDSTTGLWVLDGTYNFSPHD